MIENKIQNWLKELDKILEENRDVRDENWFKTLCDVKHKLNKTLEELK